VTKGELIKRLEDYSDDTIVRIETAFLSEDSETRYKQVIDVDETLDGDILLMQEPF
jgi:hypothetical protein